MSTNVRKVNDGDGKARKAALVYFVELKPGGGVDSAIVGPLGARKLDDRPGIVASTQERKLAGEFVGWWRHGKCRNVVIGS